MQAQQAKKLVDATLGCKSIVEHKREEQLALTAGDHLRGHVKLGGDGWSNALPTGDLHRRIQLSSVAGGSERVTLNNRALGHGSDPIQSTSRPGITWKEQHGRSGRVLGDREHPVLDQRRDAHVCSRFTIHVDAPQALAAGREAKCERRAKTGREQFPCTSWGSLEGTSPRVSAEARGGVEGQERWYQ